MILLPHNTETIINLISEYWPRIDQKYITKLLKGGGGIDPFEGLILYCYILKFQPKGLIEFSPNLGYSTQWIALALQQLGQQNSFWTFEINKRILPQLKNNLEYLKQYVSIIDGDALETIPQIIKDKQIDLCFIDSNHGYKFAINYIDIIFPLLMPNCFITVHDICTDESLIKSNSFKTSLFDSSDEHSGEYKAIKDFLSRKKINYCVLHSITGGQHEGANLPINEKFYSKIKNITSRDFISNLICPKTIFFNI